MIITVTVTWNSDVMAYETKHAPIKGKNWPATVAEIDKLACAFAVSRCLMTGSKLVIDTEKETVPQVNTKVEASVSEKFKINDRVIWFSSAGASGMKKKKGVVVQVIPPSGDAQVYIERAEKEWNAESKWGRGAARNHESYLVLVPNVNSNKKSALYLPVVKNLAKVEK